MAASSSAHVQQFLAGVGVQSMEDVGTFLQSMNNQIQESEKKLQEQRQLFEQQMLQATAANTATQQQLEQAVGTLTSMGQQLQDALARTAEAEKERADALKIAAALASESIQGGRDIVDNKGVGQPFKFSDSSKGDFSEWRYKFVGYVKARYGPEVEGVLEWAAYQKKTIMKVAISTRSVSWDENFGESADDLDRVPGLQKKLEGIDA